MVTRVAVNCSLCGLTTLHPLANQRGDLFCCPSCREVAALLAEAPAETSIAEAGPKSEKEAQSVMLTLGDMWCPSCAWLVAEQLKRTPGVASAQVSFVQQQAHLTYDAALTDPGKLKKRVRTLGYRAALPGEKPRDEEESLYYRLVICSVLALHDVIIGFSIYGRELLGLNTPESEPLVAFFRLMMFVTAVPVLLLLGLPILRAGLASLLRGQPNIHTLITMGTFSAFALSVRNLVAGSGNVYFDTVSMLLFLVSVGRWLEIQAHKASNDAMQRLLKHIPDQAARVTARGEETVPVADLRPGMRVRVRPGERFPVDGLIAVGEGDVDQSLLTGEPKPVTKRAGNAVQAGTISLDGAFEVIISAVGDATTAGQIGRLLHEALWQRSPLERLADKLAAWMTPVALALGTIAFLFWNARSGTEQGLLIALSVLLIACPCALGLATPLTLWLGLGRAAESGAILRSTAAIERLARVKKIFLDKTGTLTVLPMQVKEIAIDRSNDFSNSATRGAAMEREFIRLVASVENQSEHPLAKAIVAYARKKRIKLIRLKEFIALPGRGVKAILTSAARDDEMTVWIGSERLMAEQKLHLPKSLQQQAHEFRAAGMLVVFAGWERQVRGLLALGETARAEASEALRRLRESGLEAAILTGDEAHAGHRWREALGIPVYTRLTPEEKMSRLQEVSAEVAMVGDGINDGPALAAASVGLAMNHGTDVARTAADVVLMREDLRLIPWLIELSRAAMRRVRENLGWAFIYNLIGVGLAMAGLLQPVLAALAMVISSLLVTANAMRLRRFPLLV